jgi:hypothetical protein
VNQRTKSTQKIKYTKHEIPQHITYFIIITYTRIKKKRNQKSGHYVRSTTVSTSFVQSNKSVHGKPAEIRLDYMQYKGVGEVAARTRRIRAAVPRYVGFLLLAWLTFRPWIWRQYIPPKRRCTSTVIHGVTISLTNGSIRILHTESLVYANLLYCRNTRNKRLSLCKYSEFHESLNSMKMNSMFTMY